MLQAALSWVGSDRLMLGTDSPFMGDSTLDIKAVIDRSPLLSDEERAGVYERNARRFLRLDDQAFLDD
jgi:predicted TIM-barrel fold metal-dependent hydrolase